MGREVRRVPATWVHPTNERRLIPLHDGFNQRLASWIAENDMWNQGLRSDWNGGYIAIEPKYRGMSFSEYDGDIPKQEDYMLDWPKSERTHYQMYETCTEGTPISPVMRTPEELAHWLVNNGASAFGNSTATYEQWLGTIGSDGAVSAVMINGEVKSGVEIMGQTEFDRNQWPDVIGADNA